MPANEFEKQVQQKLEELQIRPTTSVWSEVESQLRKEKKRRRIVLFWWLLPVLLATSGGAYYFINQNQNNPVISNTNDFQKDPVTTTTPTQELAGEKVQPVQQTPTTGEIQQTAPSTINKSSAGNSPIIVNAVPGKTHKQKGPLLKRDIEIEDQLAIISTIPESKKQEKVTPIVNEADTAKETIVLNELPASPVQNDLNKTEENIKPDTVIAIIPDPIINEAEKQQDIPKQKSRWRFGIELKPGLSNTHEGSLFAAKDREQLYATPNTGGGTIGSGISFGPLAPPVLVTSPSPAISAGLDFLATREVSKKLSMTFGIGYQYIASSIKVGQKVNGSRQVTNDFSSGVVVNSYYTAAYTGNGDQSYTNQFHFATAKAGLSWQLVNSKKFSLSWDNSISFNHLFHTTALLFDPTYRSYYRDPEVFKKSQLFFTTGFSIPVMKHKKFSLSLNPFASYGLTPVYNSASGSNAHYFNGGLGLKFLFPWK
jgi:hypothetical protein